MSQKVLAISSSPRPNGNTEALLRRALDGAKATGAEVEHVALRAVKIAPCVECNACCKTGLCRVDDDYQPIFRKMVETDCLIFATPVYFMAVSAQAKLLIDRCQCLWSRKYVLKEPLFTGPGRDRRGMVIAVGGSKSKKMFDCIRMTMKYYFDVLDMNYTFNLFVNQVDRVGDILSHPTAMKEAFRLGKELMDTSSPAPDKPVNVELF